MNTSAASALVQALFHFLWEGAAIAVALAAALYVFRVSSARARYALACSALLAMLMSFGVTLAMIWPHTATLVTHSATAHGSFPVPPPVFFYEGFFLSKNRPASPPSPKDLVAPLWMLGVALFSLRSFASWLAASRLRRTGVALAAPAWQEKLVELGRAVGSSRPVILLQSYLIEIPVVIGVLKPVILVPAQLFTGFSPEQLELILIHELAHIRRHDYLVNLLQSLAEDLLFYHPAVWWVSSVIRAEREHCCDDAVVEAKGDAIGFAEALATLEQRRWSAHQAALAANGGHLMNRIQRLLNGRDRSRFSAAPAFSASLLCAVGALAVSTIHAQTALPLPQLPLPPTPRPPILIAQAAAPVPAPVTQPAPEPEPTSLKSKLETPYAKWLNEEVVYIISEEERKVFHSLDTDQERVQFIEQFWRHRDPTPDTDNNEFREEYYRRIAYANDNFPGSGVPGWKTDRGMIYIKYGSPDEREEHPGGGTYQRPIEAGGGQTTTLPFEKWRYRYLAGLGNDVTIEFVDTTGKGDYHMTMDPAEKDALTNVPGAGRSLYEQLGTRFTRSDGSRVGAMPLPASMDQFARLEQFSNLQRPMPAPPPEDTIENIVFHGTRRVAQDVLRTSIQTRTGDKFDPKKIDQDMVALWNTQRFDDISWTPERGQKGWIVNINVIERAVPRN